MLAPTWISIDTTSVHLDSKNITREVLRVVHIPSSFSAPRDRNSTQSNDRQAKSNDRLVQSNVHVRQGSDRETQSNRESQSHRPSQMVPLKPSQIALQDRETFYMSLSMHTLGENGPSQNSQSNLPRSSQFSQSNLPNITYSTFAAQNGRVVYLPWLDVFLVVYTIATQHHMITPGITIVSRVTAENKGTGSGPLPTGD